MEIMNTAEIITMCFLLLTIVFSAITIILTGEYVRKNRLTRLNDKKRISEIDEHRDYYEKSLYRLQNEMIENRRRWEDVNHLIISAQSKGQLTSYENEKVYSGKLFANFGIDIENISVEKKSVFVLTPFLSEELDTFMAIKQVCGEVDLKCTRGDEIYRDRDIFTHILESIAQANIIIANINGRNPNVFYELGICHSLGKPVIVISKSKNDLPFDIKSKNIIFYKDLSELQLLLKSELLKIFIG